MPSESRWERFALIIEPSSGKAAGRQATSFRSSVHRMEAPKSGQNLRGVLRERDGYSWWKGDGLLPALVAMQLIFNRRSRLKPRCTTAVQESHRSVE